MNDHRLFAFLPCAVGELQIRIEPLGYSLLVSELLLAGTSVTAIAVQSQLVQDAKTAQRAGAHLNEAQVNSRIRVWGEVRDIGFWSFAAVAVAGIVQAQLEYQPS